MTRKELYNICHDEAVAYANSERCSKRTVEEKSFLIQGYLDAMMEARKSEITEKKQEYPKTYEECCKVMGVNHTNDLDICEHCDYKTEITYYEDSLLEKIETLYRLYICRDAYWKIAGEDMGLGKPWEPSKDKTVYSIYRHSNKIGTEMFLGESVTFEFPTPGMRDAFKENFGPNIEICKEFL